MRSLIVTEELKHWRPLAGLEAVSAGDYLKDPSWIEARRLRVINLCRSYRYQSLGYYVSLLAAARRHRPFPDLMTVLDMRNRGLVRGADDDLDDLIQRSLASLRSDRFELSIYFGHNLSARYDRLAARLFALFPAPFLRAQFAHAGGRWRIRSIGPVGSADVPDSHWDFVHERARAFVARPRGGSRAKAARYHLALLHDPKEVLAPSSEASLKRFERAARGVGFAVERIDRDDIGRLGEFDALFIRETTYVNHHTFRFSRRAESEGLVVIDDPRSILRCTNKVFLAEALGNAEVPIPRTLVLDRTGLGEVRERVGFPCVLKVPDSAFSQGVVRCDDEPALTRESGRILEDSDLIIAQEYIPTQFDWRVGVLDGKALFACRYHMARGHWQIVQQAGKGRYRYGRVEPVPLALVPRKVLRTALRAAETVGHGLYGVDLKVPVPGRVVVMEVNDNPNIDAGCEDKELGLELYRRIAQVFWSRVEARFNRSTMS